MNATPELPLSRSRYDRQHAATTNRREPIRLSERADDVTRLLGEIAERPAAADELLPLVYEELRGLAERQMRQERSSHTLQPTALVHEAYLRLVAPAARGEAGPAWSGRAHFFRVAAEAMRRHLIDHARRRNAEKRGGAATRRPLEEIELTVDQDPQTLLELDEAMTRLEREDRDAFEVVRLRFYGGLSVEEAAAVLGRSERSVHREWAFAKSRLYQMLAAQPGG